LLHASLSFEIESELALQAPDKIALESNSFKSS